MSANIRPSRKMPAPPNMRRTVTGPKPERCSLMKARYSLLAAMDRLFGGDRLGGLQHHRLTAAASRGLVRVIEDKARFQCRFPVVHLGAEQEQDCLWIDEDLDAFVLHDLIERALLFGPFHGVFHAGAAAILDAEPQGDPRVAALADDGLHAQGGGLGKRHHFGAGTGHSHEYYHILS